jgi:hypothetical protein
LLAKLERLAVAKEPVEVGIGWQAFIATLGLENGNGGYQVSEIGADLVKASLVFANGLTNLIAFPA